MIWYDGGLMPDKPEELGDEELNKGGGALLIGSKGKLLHDTYGMNPRLLPKSLHDSYGKPPQKLPRIENEDHEMNWVERRQRQNRNFLPVRVRRAPHRSHAPRHSRSPRRKKDQLRRRQHARHQRRRGQRLPTPRLPPGLGLIINNVKYCKCVIQPRRFRPLNAAVL